MYIAYYKMNCQIIFQEFSKSICKKRTQYNLATKWVVRWVKITYSYLQRYCHGRNVQYSEKLNGTEFFYRKTYEVATVRFWELVRMYNSKQVDTTVKKMQETNSFAPCKIKADGKRKFQKIITKNYEQFSTLHMPNFIQRKVWFL